MHYALLKTLTWDTVRKLKFLVNGAFMHALESNTTETNKSVIGSAGLAVL